MGLHAMKNAGSARTSASSVEPLRPSRERRANHGSGGASPYPEPAFEIRMQKPELSLT
jgi:hypothetical protein